MALSFGEGAALGGALGGLGKFAADKLGYSSSAQARARNAKFLGLDNPQGRLADLATNQQTGEPIIGANNGGIAQLLNPTPTAQQQAPALDRSATPPAPPVPQNVAAPVAPQQPAQSSQSGGAFGSNVRTEDLIAVLRDPDSNEEDKAIAKSILSPRLASQDPSNQLDMEYKRAQIAALGAKGGTKWSKLDDGTLYNENTGETKTVGAQGGSKLFSGNSVEAQGLNQLVESGQLSAAEAAQLAAGKPITDPSTGAIIFMTPQGIFGRSPGQSPQPLTPQSAAPGAPSAPQAAGAPQAPGAAPGQIQLTPGKMVKPTEAQVQNQAFARMVIPEVAKVEAGFNELGTFKAKGLDAIPGGLGNYYQSDTYQQARTSIQNIAQMYLYSVSGKSAPIEEVKKMAESVTPAPGDGPGQLLDKKARIQRMVQGIQVSAAGGEGMPGAPPSPGAPPVPPPQAAPGGSPRAVNPQTGQAVIFNGTEWVPE